MKIPLTAHATVRMQRRAISPEDIQLIMEHADIERPANDNCRLYRVSSGLARALHNERIARLALIWSDDNGAVVTVLPVKSTRAGRYYRHRR